MLRRVVASAALATCVLVLTGDALAQEPLFPALDCWEEVGETEVRLHFGVTNLLDQEVANPALNSLTIDGNAVTPPTNFKPGYTARRFSLTVSVTTPYVSWALGQPDYTLFVEPAQLQADERCSNEAGVAGPAGPAGPQGPQGPAGPAGESAGQLLTQCTLVTASIPEGKDYGTELLIACGPDETLMQGGGVCGKGNLRGSYQVDAQTWKVVCRSPKGIEGTALCCPQD